MAMSESERIQKIIRMVPHLYLLEHYQIRGKPITFDIKNHNQDLIRAHRPWQKQIIDDNHPDKVIRKSRQLGLSEMGVAESLWFADTKPNTKLMYTFPRNRQMTDFVKTRFNPVLASTDYFREILDSANDSIEVKRIKDSFMMFRSAWGGAMGEGADIDFLAFDEYDRMGDNIELAFQEGLKSSAYGWLRRWSTPTIPGRGIDHQFQRSDQHYYTHKCKSCNHWQVLNIEDNIMQMKPDGINIITDEIEKDTFTFVCAKCSKPLDRWYGAEWVSNYPSRKSIRGYHISQLDAVWITADDIKARELKYTSKQLYHNYVIGIPFTSSGLQVTEEDIHAAKRYEHPKVHRAEYDKVVVGIDWGKTNWALLVGIKGNGELDIINTFQFDDNPDKPLDPVNKLAAMLRPFDPDLIVSDVGYGADRNSYLSQLFKGKVWGCRYTTTKSGKMYDSWNDKSREVTVDKTLKIQRMLYHVKEQGIGMWRMDEQMMMLTKHLKNIRIMDEEEDGVTYQKATSVGEDHLADCLTYAILGAEHIKGVYKNKGDFNFDFI